MKTQNYFIIVTLSFCLISIAGCGSVSRWKTPPTFPTLITDSYDDSEREDVKRELTEEVFIDGPKDEFKVENVNIDEFIALLNLRFQDYTVIKCFDEEEQVKRFSMLCSGSIDDVLLEFCLVNGLKYEKFYEKRFIFRDVQDIKDIYVCQTLETDLDESLLKDLFINESVLFLFNGSKCLIRGSLKNVENVVNTIKTIEEKKQSYIVKLVFARMRTSDLFKIQAELQVNNLDLIARQYDFLSAFSANFDFNASDNKNYDYTVHTIYSTDRCEASVKIGTEINRETRTLSEMGVSSVSGYRNFNDGIEFTLTPKRLSGDVVDVQLRFTKSKFNSTTDLSKSQVDLEYKGIQLQLEKPYYLTSYDDGANGFSNVLFGGQKSASREVTTVWIQLKPVK